MVPEAEARILDETVTQICGAGAVLSGSQRQAAATLARRLWTERTADVAGTTGTMGTAEADVMAEIVAQFTLDAHSVRPEWIESMVGRGASPVELVELLSVVSRTIAIDTFCFALGIDAWPLQHVVGDPGTGDGPHGEVDPTATFDGGWLPTVGPAWPTNALSAVPQEDLVMHRLHAVFYLATDQMGDLDAQRGLHRTQMELIAARTSLLNECFF